MPTWIALFRGINVGGHNLLPMKALASELETLKLKQVRTYIQSGNVVFESPAKTAAPLAKKISALVEKRHGFSPQVLLLSTEELQTAINDNPFPKAVDDPKTLHFFFLSKPPSNPNLTAIEEIQSPTESYVLQGRVFYLHAPDGIGRSKLVRQVEKLLGVAATARNYRTVEKLLGITTQP